MSGKLTVVGLGPGRSDWCTPAVTSRLVEATDLVGYEPYLAMVDTICQGRRHPSDNERTQKS